MVPAELRRANERQVDRAVLGYKADSNKRVLDTAHDTNATSGYD
jgi:hypothetical protein